MTNAVCKCGDERPHGLWANGQSQALEADPRGVFALDGDRIVEATAASGARFRTHWCHGKKAGSVQ